MKLIVISCAADIPREAELINSLFAAGLSCFHLRKPGSSAEQLTALLHQLHPAFYDRIALHQHHELALAFGIRRLHYPEQIRKQTAPETLHGCAEEGYTLSTSIHDIQDAAGLAVFDYVFFGPVFDSLSKPGYRSSIPAGFRIDTAQLQTALIALGGIEARHLETLGSMGFDGAAVSGVLWNDPSQALAAFHQLRSALPDKERSND